MKANKQFTPLPVFLLLTISIFMSLPAFAQITVFYGTTSEGGANDSGTIFKFNPSTNNETVVWNFGSGKDGKTPNGDLVLDPVNSLFYGMTSVGGKYDSGTIFSFNPSTSQEKVVWNLGHMPDGALPWGDLIWNASDSLFYGMTSVGGLHSRGIIFSFNPAKDTEIILLTFNGPNGAEPYADFVWGPADTLLYAMTAYGGTHGFGVILTFKPSIGRESVIWNFSDSPDGSTPTQDLLWHPATSLFYAMTFIGGDANGDGAIISFNPSTKRDSVLWEFAGSNGYDGYAPWGNLVWDSARSLFYGMTENGGNISGGAIVSFNLTTNRDSVLWDLGHGTDGSVPIGTLTFDSTNSLYYGTTFYGGTKSVGALISFNPAKDSEKVVWNFGIGADGTHPYKNLTRYKGMIAGISSSMETDSKIEIYPNPGNGMYFVTGINKGDVLEVYNSLGQKLITLDSGNSSLQFDISTEPAGVYLLRIFDHKYQSLVMRKIVKD